jgi:hypothetical protein
VGCGLWVVFVFVFMFVCQCIYRVLDFGFEIAFFEYLILGWKICEGVNGFV